MLRRMRAEAIFGPVSVLALWTGAVILLTGLRRILAVRARRVSRNAFRVGEAPDVPEDVAVVNRNLMNLLEMPVLFYVVSIAFYVTHHVGRGPLVLAWVYVGLRLLHSWEHLTTNYVPRRLVAFALSNFVLVSLWVSFIRAVF
jgi:hypothetical protein